MKSKSTKPEVDVKKTKKDIVDNKPWIASPFLFILLCTVLISSIAFGLQNKQYSPTVIEAINSEYVNLNVSSDTWSCPYLSSSETENGNSVFIYNPSDNKSNITLRLYNLDGNLFTSKDIELKAKSSSTQLLSTYGQNLNVSALVESFGAPVIVYRDIKLSDGKEIVPCTKNPKDVLEFNNLSTKRNTNSILMLNNPHSDSIVVDIKARLVDTSVTPFKVVLDDTRGVVVGAYGRTDIDLQAMFGRYPLLNITVVTRSGFISGEVLVDYKDEGITTGQSIVTSALTNYTDDTSYVFGNSPLNLFAQSNTNSLTYVDVDSYGTENRMISAQDQTLTVGATLAIVDPGLEFGFHVVKLTTKQDKVVSTETDSSDDDALIEKNLFYNTIVASYFNKDLISNSNATSLSSDSIVLAAADSDFVGIYNPSKKAAKITISFIGSAVAPKILEVVPNGFTYFSLNDIELAPGTLLLNIDSSQDVVAASTRQDYSGVTNGVYIKK